MSDQPQKTTQPPMPQVHPDLAAHAARYQRAKIVQTGARTHTLIGYNIANVSIINAPEGLILVDAMAQEDDARRALADIKARFPAKRIRAVIYTHFHNDHVNGVEGFVSADDVAQGEVEIWAHADLMHFVTEVSAGTGPIMGRRASYTFGAALPRGEEGFVHAGLGLPHNPGPRGFIAPTQTVAERTTVTLCGLTLELIPIPSETDDMLGVYLPAEEIFLTGDCIQGEAYPNLYTLRGTPYRDPMQWVRTIDWIRHDLRPKAVIPHHGHPLTDADAIHDVLTAYRDAIQFTHDQTVRFINQGYSPQEIALKLEMPDHLASHPWLGEFYGTLRHCIPAIFVGKIGWFAGDPVDLDPLPKPERAARMVALMGGAEAVLAEAERAMADEDYLWAAEMFAYVVTLSPENEAVRRRRGAALRGWSYAQANPNWRNWGLSCAMELDPPSQDDSARKQLVMAPPAVVNAFPPANILRTMATRLKAEEVGERHLTMGFQITDQGLNHALELRRGVCEFHEQAPAVVDVELSFERGFLSQLISGKTNWIKGITEGEVKQSAGTLEAAKLFFSSFEPPHAPHTIKLVSR